MIRFTTIFSVVLSLFLTVEAVEVKQKRKKVDVKCHVELYGGQQTIYLATIKENHLHKMSDRIVNRKIPTIYSKNKQQVYQAFECVRLNDVFSSSKARNLFAAYPK